MIMSYAQAAYLQPADSPEHTYVVWPDNTVCEWEDLEEYLQFQSDDYRLETSNLCFEEFLQSLY